MWYLAFLYYGPEESRYRQKGFMVWGEQNVEGLTSTTGQLLDEVDVNAVDVGTLFAVDFDTNEMLIEVVGYFGVGKRLAIHHVTPVASRVADREKDRGVRLSSQGDRLRPPGVPVDGVVRMLKEVGAGFLREPVGESVGGNGVHIRFLLRINLELSLIHI